MLDRQLIRGTVNRGLRAEPDKSGRTGINWKKPHHDLSWHKKVRQGQAWAQVLHVCVVCTHRYSLHYALHLNMIGSEVYIFANKSPYVRQPRQRWIVLISWFKRIHIIRLRTVPAVWNAFMTSGDEYFSCLTMLNDKMTKRNMLAKASAKWLYCN